MYELQVYTDGGSRGNPGPSAWAYVIVYNNAIVRQDHQFYGASKPNNETEYKAMERALAHCLDLTSGNPNPYTQIIVKSDSQFVLNSMFAGWKVKAPNLVGLHAQVQVYMQELKRRGIRLDFEWVRGHNGDVHNEICDHLVNVSLDNWEMDERAKDQGLIPASIHLEQVKQSLDHSQLRTQLLDLLDYASRGASRKDYEPLLGQILDQYTINPNLNNNNPKENDHEAA